MKKPRVLLIAKAFPPVPGGVESYSESVALAYATLGYDVTVLTQTRGPSGWEERTYQQGSLRVFNVGPGGQAKVFPKFIYALRNILSRNDFIFIHTTTWRVGLVAFLCRPTVPLALTVHGREIQINPWYLRPFLSKVMTRADAIISVSEATRSVLEDVHADARGASKAVVLFNGISFPDLASSLRDERANRDGEVHLLSFARLVERKNIHGCIAALAMLKARGVSNFSYTVCGTGPLIDLLKAQVVQSGLADKVRFLGYVKDEDIPRQYIEADIFLHPQISLDAGRDFEGFGIVIADAMSFGTPVVVGNSGGPKDFVKHGVTGLVVDGENIEELALAIESLILDKETRARLSREAREYSLSNLSWTKHAQGIVNALRASPRAAISAHKFQC
jgi:Glycosyltransferase